MPLLDLTGTFGLRVAGCDVSEVRIAGMGGRWERRVNLATNPSFEATSGTVVVRTNLCTTPTSYTPAADGPYPGLGAGPYTGSAEIGGVRQAVDPLALVGGVTYERLLIEAGAVPLGGYFDGSTRPVLRTNLHRFPLLTDATAAGSWIGTGGTAVRSAIDDSRFIGGRAIRWRITVAPTASVSTLQLAGGSKSNGLGMPHFAGKRTTFVCRVISPHPYGGGGQVMMQNVYRDGVQGANITPVARYSTPIPANEPGYLWATFDLPSDLTAGNINFTSNPWMTDDEIFVGDIDIYEGDYDPTREFVAPGQRDSTGLLCEWSGPVNASPSVVVDPDFTPAWTGPVGASTSVLRGQVIADCISNSANPARVASTRWKASGERSLRISARHDSSDSFCERRTPLPPGRIYRVSAMCHLWQPQSGSVSARARGIMLYGYRRLPDGTYETVSSPRIQAPNETGSHRVSVVWAVPSDVFTATNFATPGGVVRLYNGGSIGGGDVWWDDLVIEEISDATPTHDEPFHGDTPDTPDALYRWNGPPHGSPSTAYYAWQPV